MSNNGSRAAGSGSPKLSNSRPRRTMPVGITDVYLYAGHGNQIPGETFEERSVVPPGKVFIFFAEHAKPFKSYLFDSIWELMSKNPELFEDPFTNFDRIKSVAGGTMRIYKEGDKIPSIEYSPYAGLSNGQLYPSGVYAPNKEETPNALPAYEISKGAGLLDIYKGNQNKTFFQSCFQTNLETATLSSVKNKHINIRDLLHCLPNGIHYFLSCRLIQGQAKQIRDIIHNFMDTIQDLSSFLFYKDNVNDYTMEHKIPLNWKRNWEALSYDVQESKIRNTLGGFLKISFYLPEETYTNIPEDVFEKNYFDTTEIKAILDEIYKIYMQLATSPLAREQTGEEFLDDFLLNLNEMKERKHRFVKIIDTFIELLHEKLQVVLGPVGVMRTKSTGQQNQSAGKREKKTRKQKSTKRKTRRQG